MTPEQREQARRLRDEALKRRPEERRRFLDEACGGEPALLAEATALLEAHERMATAGPPATGGGPSDDAAPDLVGRRVGNYEVVSRIGAGGMGVVYKALQARPRRAVALKTMQPGFDQGRFEDEWQILGGFRHPGIAHVYEAGEHRDETGGVIPYFTMEYVPAARSVTEYADAHGLGLRQRIALFADVCDAVQAAHNRGIAHLDLKPGNILVGPEGQPRIIDFGVAHALAAETTGRVPGTPQYMSPEQRDGDPDALDLRCDVYALGMILHELVHGRRPEDTPAPDAPDTPAPATAGTPRRGLDEVIDKAMRRRPAARYRAAADLGDELRRWLDGRAPLAAREARPRRRPVPWLAGAVVVVILAAAAGLLLPRTRPAARSPAAAAPAAPAAPAAEPDTAVEIRAVWKSADDFRAISPPAEPGAAHVLAPRVAADRAGDLYLLRLEPEGATVCDPRGSCAGVAYDPQLRETADMECAYYLADDPPGPYCLVAVLLAPGAPARGLCEGLPGSPAARGIDRRAPDPARLAAVLRRFLADPGHLQGCATYAYVRH